MTAEEQAFQELMGRLREGDPLVAAEVFSRFAHRLIGLTRKLMKDELRSKADPEDLVQSALGSFFIRSSKGEFRLVDWGSLWGLLATITTRKSDEHARRFSTQSRDVRREASGQAAGDDGQWTPKERVPTLHEAVEMVDLIEKLMTRLNLKDREILLLSMNEHTSEEMGEMLGCHERTIDRALERIEKKAKRLFNETD